LQTGRHSPGIVKLPTFPCFFAAMLSRFRYPCHVRKTKSMTTIYIIVVPIKCNAIHAKINMHYQKHYATTILINISVASNVFTDRIFSLAIPWQPSNSLTFPEKRSPSLSGHSVRTQNSFTFSDDDQVENTQMCIDNTSSHRLATTLAIAARTITRMTGRQQQTDAAICQYTLLHRKTLLVIPTRNANHVTLEVHKSQN